MAEKVEDLNLPQAAVLKIIREAIPASIHIGKDVKSAMAKAASVFILYITSHSVQSAQASKHKSVTTNDIFNALEEIEFGHFTEVLKEYLAEQASIKEAKKDGKHKKDGEDSIMEEEEEEEKDS